MDYQYPILAIWNSLVMLFMALIWSSYNWMNVVIRIVLSITLAMNVLVANKMILAWLG